jgi:hypothetical protein
LGLLLAAGAAIAIPDEAPPATLCNLVRDGGRFVPAEDLRIPANAVIGEIHVYALNVFDTNNPSQDNVLFRTANQIHVPTREHVVRQRLLVESGDELDPRRLEESARSLRALGNFYDACVEPAAVRGNVVDLIVVTRDVWTLSAGIGFQREGGGNTFQASARDSNFLGTGKHLSIKYVSDPDRTERRVRYFDPAFRGSRSELGVHMAEKSDGHRMTLDFRRPFFSLDSRWSAGTRLVSDKEIVRLYSAGEVADRFVRENTFFEIRGGLSRGYGKSGSNRLLFGYTYDDNRFSTDTTFDPNDPTDDPFFDPDEFGTFPPFFVTPGPTSPANPFGPDPFGDLPRPEGIPDNQFFSAPSSLLSSKLDPNKGFPHGIQAQPGLPPDRYTVSYPWVGLQLVGDGFVLRKNLDQLVRTEDLNLGREINLRLGYSSTATGAHTDQLIFKSSASVGKLIGGRHTFLASGYGEGRFGGGENENVLVGGSLRHFVRTFGPHQLHTSVNVDMADNLDPDSQLLIGGDSGLRGYSRRFQSGDRRYLFTIEHRWYTDLELFNLFHVGAAAFFDMGGAWYSADPLAKRELLKDIGVGLRFGSSRSAQGAMVHFDVAYPLDGDTRKIQWLISSRDSF